MIPYGRQDITQEDIDAVVAVLRSDYLTQGPKVPEFESSVAQYCEASYAVAVNSATSALHIACLALGVGRGDYVWTSPISFVASANCALYCGAKIDFIDIDPQTYNLSVDELKKKLVLAAATNCLPKVLIPVHLCGQSAQMKEIHALAKEYGFKIIEDASHAIGGQYLGRPIGSCQFSDITIFSFHPVKIITTAEGGMATTNSSLLAEKMSLLRSHGITKDSLKMTKKSEGEWYYQQIDLGFNYRMTELQAALGLSQLNRLNRYVVRRHELAARYNDLLSTLPILLPHQDIACHSSYHLYPIRLDFDQTQATHQEVFNFLREKQIGVNLHYIPIHLQPFYEKFGFKPGQYPEAEKYYQSAITLPLYPGLTGTDQQFITNCLREVLC
jgi:UDP-4-amino-4,6-dideoxy-N-acetyl-beta-L-altrosamine transaminase